MSRAMDHGERYLKYPRQRTVSINWRQTMIFARQTRIGIICVSWKSGEQHCWIIKYLVKVFPSCYSYLTLAYEITKKHPKYHGYSNNCQNFVQNLLKYVCPRSTAPPTIKEIMNLWRGILRYRTMSSQKMVMLEIVARSGRTRKRFGIGSGGCPRKNECAAHLPTLLTY
jgi:hypothetical protein